MHRNFAANTYYSLYHNIDIFVTRCYTVVRLDYDSPRALIKTIVLDFARAIVYVYHSQHQSWCLFSRRLLYVQTGSERVGK